MLDFADRFGGLCNEVARETGELTRPRRLSDYLPCRVSARARNLLPVPGRWKVGFYKWIKVGIHRWIKVALPFPVGG